MNRPSQRTLWTLAGALLLLALVDITFTSIGLFFFAGKEGNPLLVMLAEYIPWGSENQRVVATVWLSKISLICITLLAVHQVVKSHPARDDWVMFIGLILSILVYIGVASSWLTYFVLVLLT